MLWVRVCLLLPVCLCSVEDNGAILGLSLGTTITNLMTTVGTTCSRPHPDRKVCKVSDHCWQSLYNTKHPPPASEVRTSLSEKIHSHDSICTSCSAQREKRVYEWRRGVRSQMWMWTACAMQVTLVWCCQIWLPWVLMISIKPVLHT